MTNKSVAKYQFAQLSHPKLSLPYLGANEGIDSIRPQGVSCVVIFPFGSDSFHQLLLKKLQMRKCVLELTNDLPAYGYDQTTT